MDTHEARYSEQNKRWYNLAHCGTPSGIIKCLTLLLPYTFALHTNNERLVDKNENEDVMSIQQFWEHFSKQDIEKAINTFELLSNSEKTAVFSEFFQKSAFSRNPMVISVLYRELLIGKTFEDFHKSWFPPKEYCHEIKKDGEVFQQVFPAPTRVYNAVNMENPNEILSVGFTWIDSEEQGKQMLSYSKVAGKDKLNQDRHENIDTVARKVSSKMYELKSSDNLGVPFKIIK
ncbi:MAG: hypothetical protein ACD_29C00426G0002 [uncultured bacterium]|nr:MAG: hypothetical protein ACD_29C00426G0002 [uncultured bacterium]